MPTFYQEVRPLTRWLTQAPAIPLYPALRSSVFASASSALKYIYFYERSLDWHGNSSATRSLYGSPGVYLGGAIPDKNRSVWLSYVGWGIVGPTYLLSYPFAVPLVLELPTFRGVSVSAPDLQYLAHYGGAGRGWYWFSGGVHHAFQLLPDSNLNQSAPSYTSYRAVQFGYSTSPYLPQEDLVVPYTNNQVPVSWTRRLSNNALDSLIPLVNAPYMPYTPHLANIAPPPGSLFLNPTGRWDVV